MKPNNVYKLKVTLYDAPPIWRRLLVPGNLTFSDLYVIIQDAMGWWDQRLHDFEVINPVTGNLEITYHAHRTWFDEASSKEALS